MLSRRARDDEDHLVARHVHVAGTDRGGVQARRIRSPRAARRLREPAQSRAGAAGALGRHVRLLASSCARACCQRGSSRARNEPVFTPDYVVSRAHADTARVRHAGLRPQRAHVERRSSTSTPTCRTTGRTSTSRCSTRDGGTGYDSAARCRTTRVRRRRAWNEGSPARRSTCRRCRRAATTCASQPERGTGEPTPFIVHAHGAARRARACRSSLALVLLAHSAAVRVVPRDERSSTAGGGRATTPWSTRRVGRRRSE